MHKDFDLWNGEKKAIHAGAHAPLYRAREVRWCHFGVNIGYEQDGTGDGYARPALILKGFSRLVCLVIPLTTSTKENPYHVPLGDIGGRKAFAVISQIRLIDTRRLEQRLAIINKGSLKLFEKPSKIYSDGFSAYCPLMGPARRHLYL